MASFGLVATPVKAAGTLRDKVFAIAIVLALEETDTTDIFVSWLAITALASAAMFLGDSSANTIRWTCRFCSTVGTAKTFCLSHTQQAKMALALGIAATSIAIAFCAFLDTPSATKAVKLANIVVGAIRV